MFVPDYDGDALYVIENIRAFNAFFRCLATLVDRDSIVIGIGCYGPDPRVSKWFDSLPKMAVPKPLDYRVFFELHQQAYPKGGAHYFPATASALEKLVHLASLVDSPELLCDHILAFSEQKAIFSIHDAFDGGPMLISRSVPVERIDKFSLAMGLPFKIVRNPPYDGNSWNLDPISH